MHHAPPTPYPHYLPPTPLPPSRALCTAYPHGVKINNSNNLTSVGAHRYFYVKATASTLNIKPHLLSACCDSRGKAQSFSFFQSRSKYEILVTFRDSLSRLAPLLMNSVPGFRDHRSLAGGAVDDARASSQAQSPRERALAHALTLRSASRVPACTGSRARHMPC